MSFDEYFKRGFLIKVVNYLCDETLSVRLQWVKKRLWSASVWVSGWLDSGNGGLDGHGRFFCHHPTLYCRYLHRVLMVRKGLLLPNWFLSEEKEKRRQASNKSSNGVWKCNNSPSMIEFILTLDIPWLYHSFLPLLLSIPRFLLTYFSSCRHGGVPRWNEETDNVEGATRRRKDVTFLDVIVHSALPMSLER